jgi:hypothetical protein
LIVKQIGRAGCIFTFASLFEVTEVTIVEVTEVTTVWSNHAALRGMFVI